MEKTKAWLEERGWLSGLHEPGLLLMGLALCFFFYLIFLKL
jgi:hypothetical protein